MWTALPVVHRVRSLGRRRSPQLEEVADTTWEVAPSLSRPVSKALFLPDQLQRISGFSEFGSRELDLPKVQGGGESRHGATRAFLIRDAFLMDGALYKGTASLHLHPRSTRLPRLRVDQEIARGALYGTFGGNRYFGQWLMDDCVTYPLACGEGTPVTTARLAGGHTPGYEALLEMKPQRCGGTYFREIVVFEDVGQNASKSARFRELGEKLRRHGAPRPSHPGVFIVRGQTGARRVLQNESELAERLRERRGFTVLDPVKVEVPEIVKACAGARVVAGVEGSGLMHGIVHLAEGAGVLILQPPSRFSAIYKDLTDRDRQQFGFVVGLPKGDDFVVDPDEVERTLDLFAV